MLSKVWDEITYPFPNFNGEKVWDEITYPLNRWSWGMDK